jgi:signal transduction histidine kinase
LSWPALDSFRIHVALIAVAAVSMAALAVMLVRDVLATAEETLVREASQQCSTAAAELARQLEDRAQERGETGPRLPAEAQDISLRGLAAAVLRSYEGIKGGYTIPSSRTVLGAVVASRTEAAELDASELELIRSAAAASSGTHAQVTSAVAGQDVLVAAAQASAVDLPVAWAIKRISSVRDPALGRRRWSLVALVLLAVTAVGGVFAMSIRLRRGANIINKGLSELERDFSHRVPRVAGDLGRIVQAINRMADRRAALETSMRQQDRLAALGKAAAGVAHEIRNPLNSMRLSLELAQRRLRRSGANGEELAGALEEVDRLDSIVTRLLTFGRPDFEDRRSQDLRAIVERVVRMLEPQASAKSVRLRLALPQQPLAANVDSGQIEQVLINILLNGIEASPPGSEVEVTGRAEREEVQVAIRDSGDGVPEAIREHIFDPYFTTRDSGNGLGLAVSREFIVNHGGSLELAGSQTGAHFVIRLPALQDAE